MDEADRYWNPTIEERYYTDLRKMEKCGTTHPTTEKDKINKFLKTELENYFDKIDSRKPVRNYEAEIRLEENTKPIHQKIRILSHAKTSSAKEQVKKLLEQGVITESKSPWSSPIVMVKKANGNARMCVDYRQINEKTIGDSFPLPPSLYKQIIEVGNKKWFTSIDLVMAFHQIRMKKEHQEVTALVMENGLFEYKRMPFGLKNAPGIFQRLIVTTLWKEIDSGHAKVLLDDILLASDTLEQHMKLVSTVLQKLAEINLQINEKKTLWFKNELNYAGFIINEKGITLRPSYQEKTLDVAQPKTRKQLQSYLGLINYARILIPNLAEKTRELNKLLKEANRIEREGGNKQYSTDPEITFTNQAVTEMNNMNEILKGPLYVTPIDWNLDFHIYTDASLYAIGWALVQYANNEVNEKHQGNICLHGSRLLPIRKRPRSTIERERTGIKTALQELRYITEGTPTTIWTDHKALASEFKTDPSEDQNADLISKILEMGFKIRYVPGEKNVAADALSRLPRENEIETQVE